MVATIADLPFSMAPPDDLLGIDWGRPGFVDEDHQGFGWGIVPRLSLISTRSERIELRDALVLALHSAERGHSGSGPFDLEFVVDGETLHVPLDRFLEVWLPRLPPSPELVLAVCNPTAFPLRRPPLPERTRVWAPVGNVDSSAQHQSDTTWLLTAQSWKTL